jgi:hypothetical protein
MRLQLRVLTAAAAVAVGALLAAPTAAAADGDQTCTAVSGPDTECSSPGNVQINDSPSAAEANAGPFEGGFYPGPYPVPFDEGGR